MLQNRILASSQLKLAGTNCGSQPRETGAGPGKGTEFKPVEGREACQLKGTAGIKETKEMTGVEELIRTPSEWWIWARGVWG